MCPYSAWLWKIWLDYLWPLARELWLLQPVFLNWTIENNEKTRNNQWKIISYMINIRILSWSQNSPFPCLGWFFGWSLVWVKFDAGSTIFMHSSKRKRQKLFETEVWNIFEEILKRKSSYLLCSIKGWLFGFKKHRSSLIYLAVLA